MLPLVQVTLHYYRNLAVISVTLLCIKSKCIWAHKVFVQNHSSIIENYNKSVKRRNTIGRLDLYMAPHGFIVKQSYCETA